jgi:hypothetical protein
MPEDRKRVQRRAQSPIQPSNILSSPTSTYTSAGGRQRGAAQMTDRERARQKQEEYHRQLEADKLIKAKDSARDRPANRNVRAQSPIQPLSSPSSQYSIDGGHNRGAAPMSDREKARQKQADYYRQLEADKHVKATNSPDRHVARSQHRIASPIDRARGDSSTREHSERDRKFQKQQEYASQLKLDMQQNDSLASNRTNKSEPNLRRRPQQENDLGLNIGGGQPQMTRRQKQEEYARQIREASEKEEIATPRRALSARRQGSSPHQNKYDSNNGTGLSFGADVATAAQRANKRERQNKYREELANGSNSKPITSSRVSLHSNRSRQDNELGVRGGGAAGFSTAGLIGNQESDSDRLRKKRESQKEYYDQLQAGPSPSKNKARFDDQEYSQPASRGGQSSYDYIPPQADYERDDSHYEVNAPVGELSQRLAQAYNDPYEQPHREDAYQGQRVVQDDPYSKEPYSSEPYSRAPPPRQDSNDALQQMRADSESRIVDDNHYSPTKPVVSEDGNISFDGINPPYGRHNKGMNVPDLEGKMPSARQPKQRPSQPYDQPYQQEQDHKDQLYNNAHQGTSLMIGKMDVQTSDGRDRRAYEQQKYVQELEHEKNRAPIQSERVSLIQQKKYQGNGLPGSNVPQQLQGGYRRGAGNQQQQQQPEVSSHYSGHRGTSNGGGASSIVLGGGYGAEESPRMHRKGAREEYAEQLYQQHQPQELYAQHQQYYQHDDYSGR